MDLALTFVFISSDGFIFSPIEMFRVINVFFYYMHFKLTKKRIFSNKKKSVNLFYKKN